MPPYTDPPEHAAIPVWNAEHWFYEDFEIGYAIKSLRRTISEGESMQFNALVHDFNPYQTDELFARNQGVFGRRLVAGTLVFSLGMGLVATNCVHAFAYGYDKVRFISPVFLGDTLYTIRTNLAMEPRFKEMGLVRSACEVFKNDGELVIYCEHLQTVLYRDPLLYQEAEEQPPEQPADAASEA